MLNILTIKNAKKYSILEIEKFEKQLGCELPTQYKFFLMNIGVGIPYKSELNFSSIYEVDTYLKISHFLDIEQILIAMSYPEMIKYIRSKGCLLIADSHCPLAICIGIEKYNFNQIFLMTSEAYLEKIANTFDEFIRNLYGSAGDVFL